MALLRRHARTVFSDDSSLSDIGIDSLTMVRIIVEVSRHRDREVDAEHLAALRTVAQFRQWFHREEARAA